jgi:hypothetical protein
MTGEQLDLRELLERLVKAQIGFVLVGGLAVNAWGYLRATRDVDLVPDPDPRNLAALGELLASLGGRVQVRGGALSAKAIGTFLSAGAEPWCRPTSAQSPSFRGFLWRGTSPGARSERS